MKNKKENSDKSNNVSQSLTGWLRQGNWEHEYDSNGFTGRYRCYGGRMANGIHPLWDKNGSTKP